MDASYKPKLGQIVKILRGRDAGQYAIIINIVDQRFVKIADGDKRKFDQPKMKNVIHLQPIEEISSEIVTSLQESGRVTNGKLRYALNKVTERLNEAHEKGE